MNEFKHLKETLERYAIDVKELYKSKLTEDDARASGELINSVNYILNFNTKSFEVSLSLVDYWKYVENGRRAGKFPPPDKIKRWIEIKPVLPRPYNSKLPTIDQLTYLICRKIKLDGIQPRPLLKETLEEINKEYEDKISEALTQDLENELDSIFALIITR